MLSVFALVVARPRRWLARCSRLSRKGALAKSWARCSRIGAQAPQATTARLRRTAGSVALAVFSSVVSNARGISERTAGLTIRSSRTAAGWLRYYHAIAAAAAA